ncbi:hypothetical protein PMAYCL1PPCAC_12106, partial [Pristionchus mayeri]
AILSEMANQYGIIGRSAGSGALNGSVTSFCCKKISSKFLVDSLFFIHIVLTGFVLAKDIAINEVSWWDASRLIYMLVLIFGLAAIRSRMILPLVVCCCIMSIWFVFFAIHVFFTMIFIVSSFFDREYAIKMAKIVLYWTRVDCVGEVISSMDYPLLITMSIVCYSVFFWLAYLHDKVADAIVDILEDCGREKFVPMTRGEFIQWINGNKASSTSTTPEVSPPKSRTPSSTGNNGDKFVTVPLYPRLD